MGEVLPALADDDVGLVFGMNRLDVPAKEPGELPRVLASVVAVRAVALALFNHKLTLVRPNVLVVGVVAWHIGDRSFVLS